MKELQRSPFINGLLQAAVGEGVDTTNLHVYEVRATSTIALRGKTGTVFEKARISPNTISQLAQAVNRDPLPLMMDHNLNGAPYGKFFYAESVPSDDGEIELRGLLYVDDSEKQIKTKLDAGSIDEVSIQFLSERILCSECGFDYMQAAAEENYTPLIELACDEGHKIGENGCHTNLVGVSEAIELSLVSRGAAKNSKIIAPSDAKLGKEAQRLAAAGVEFHNFYCTASINDVGDEEVDFEKFMTTLNAANSAKESLAVELATEKTKVQGLESDVAERDTTITTLTTEKEDLETQLAAAQEGASDDESSAETLTKLSDYIGRHYVALKTLDGESDPKALDDVEEMSKFILDNETRLSAIIPQGGASVGAGSGVSEDEAKAAKLAAQTKRQADAFRAN